MTPLLSLQGVTAFYGASQALFGVDLDVAEGEVVALMGRNGMGKTTLIHEVTGLVAPDSGQVVFGGRDITHLSRPRRVRAGLARTFQITNVVTGFSARENVALAAQARDGSSFRFFRPAASERTLNDAAMAALEEVGLAGRAAVAAGSLSHGEKRALELAIALATRPRLLLLDEPLAGAGPEETERLIALLTRLKARYTILLVEHDMQAVFALADRISVLVYGRVIATNAPAAIRADPAVRAAYLGEDEVA